MYETIRKATHFVNTLSNLRRCYKYTRAIKLLNLLT